MYVYPSHFNCVGAVSVVSSPDYKPCGTGPTRRRSKDRARARAVMGAMAIRYWSEQEAIDVCKRSCESQNGAQAVQV